MSALDARMRAIAAEVAAGLAAGLPVDERGPDRVAELEKQVTELTARVDDLEKAAAPAPTAKRTASRKTAETTE